MNSATTTEAGSRDSVQLEPVRSPLFSSLIETATLEFHASMQLLAERARFLTGASGVAIAVHERDQFVYCAASGISVPEIGSVADVNKENIRECLASLQPVPSSRGDAEENATNFSLVVPLIRADKVAGFFKLVSSRTAFEKQDVEATLRLADLASTVLDHRDGAQQAECRMFELKQQEAPKATPVLWHAPDRAETSEVEASPSSSSVVRKIHTCTSCGFPVSPGRTQCVDCERNPTPDIPKTEIFTLDKQESWISAHGYTIASLLVTALAAAIIYWLR